MSSSTAVHKVNIREISWNSIGVHFMTIHAKLSFTESAVPSMRSVKRHPAFWLERFETVNCKLEAPE